MVTETEIMSLSGEEKIALKKQIMQMVHQALHDETSLMDTFKLSGYVKKTTQDEKMIHPDEFQKAMDDLDHPKAGVKYKVDVESRLGNTLAEVLGYTKDETNLMSTSRKACYESILYVANFIAFETFQKIIPIEEVSPDTISDAKNEAKAFIQDMRQEIKKEIIDRNHQSKVYSAINQLKERPWANALYDALLIAADTFYRSAQTNDDKAVFHQDCFAALDLAEQLGDHRGAKKYISQFLRKIGQALDVQTIKEKSEQISNSPTKSIEITHHFKELVHAITKPTPQIENKTTENNHSTIKFP